MSFAFEIKLPADFTPAALATLFERCQPRRIAEKLRDPLLALVRSHYESLPPNKMGAPSTGFWRSASESTQAIDDETGVTITTYKTGVAQRYYGGRIHAVRAKYLAIPISIESYGKTPKDFQNLAYVQFGRGQDAPKELVKISSADKQKAVDLNRLFIFRKSVNQEPNPAVIPNPDEIFSTIDETLNGFFS